MKVPGNADVPVGWDRGEGGGSGKRAGVNVKSAGEDTGVPWGDSGLRGWYSRGYLPHFDTAHFLQSVTYRLADSLPQTKLAELKEELEHLPENLREIERRKRIEGWLDAGMGCCALAHPAVARYVQDSFLHFHGERYHLHAWCIMPNHVHVLLEPVTNLATIVKGWKSYTARWVLKKNEELALKIPASNTLWMREYWDRYIRDAEHYRKTVEYIHYNPVKAGLCDVAEAWLWSSARLFQEDASGSADGDVGWDGDVVKRADMKSADGDVGDPRGDPRGEPSVTRAGSVWGRLRRTTTTSISPPMSAPPNQRPKWIWRQYTRTWPRSISVLQTPPTHTMVF